MKGEAKPGSVPLAELSAWDLEASRRGRSKSQSQKGRPGRKTSQLKAQQHLKQRDIDQIFVRQGRERMVNLLKIMPCKWHWTFTRIYACELSFWITCTLTHKAYSSLNSNVVYPILNSQQLLKSKNSIKCKDRKIGKYAMLLSYQVTIGYANFPKSI